jgi:hypothetical protein
MKMFSRSKTSKQKALTREPSRATAAYDSRPVQPMRPTSTRPMSDPSVTSNTVEPNTLVVAVDFGNNPLFFGCCLLYQ